MLSAGRTGLSTYMSSPSETKCMSRLNKARLSQPSQPGIMSFIYNLHENKCAPLKISLCDRTPPHTHPAALIAVGIVVRSHIHVKKVLELPLKGLKCWPVLFVLLPAVHHYAVQDFRAGGGTCHPVAQRDPLDHLQVCHGYNNHSKQLSTFINRHVVAFLNTCTRG